MIDEIGNIYDKWTVIDQCDSLTSSAVWLCRCKCGYERSILGTELRRQKAPLCTNCCRTCGKSRKETEFKGNKRTCHKCDKKRILEWKKGNKNYHNRCAAWSKRNPEAVDKYRQNEKERIQSSPQIFLRAALKDKRRKCRHKSLDSRARQKAKSPERRLVTISEDKICELWYEQNGKCAISGLLMEHRYNSLLTVSIDRIDSTRGYADGNVQLVCKWANYAKSDASNDEILAVIDILKS